MLVTYPPTENQHEQGILRHSKVPANITQITANALENYGKRIAEALQLQGLLAIEFFVLGNGKLLANEMAPRPHNSGHWTIEAALTCQFEQTIRAVMDWPLGDCSLIHPVEMTNIIGTEIEQWQDLLSEGSAKLHLYGKSTPTPGRKMGHVTRFVGI